MKAGKLPHQLLERLLSEIEHRDPRVVLGPRVGEDAALIDMGDRYLVTKTDPITFATDLIGWYLVQVNANDLAVMGATPRWFMATLLLPEGTSQDQARHVFQQLLEACRALDIALVGGHTEITYDLPRPIAVGAMLGEVAKGREVTSSGARPGDALILTKGVAIEGTAILAREAGQELVDRGVDPDVVQRARGFLFEPGISVVRDAAVATRAARVHAMHDPTEGGLATGLRELALASQVGVLLEEERVPVLPECAAFCQALGLDPLGLIASGALLAAVDPSDVAAVLAALERGRIPAWQIGRVTEAGEGLRLRTRAGQVRELPIFERDELARWFGG